MAESCLWSDLRWQADVLVLWLQPTTESEARREAVFGHVKAVLQRHPDLQDIPIFLDGSYSSKTYLPDSDIDVTLGGNSSSLDEWVHHSNVALCRAAMSPVEFPAGQDASEGCAPSDSKRGGSCGAKPLGMHAAQSLQIRNVTFINGKVKVVTAVVGNLAVDVSAGRLGALAAAALLHEADRVLSAPGAPPLCRPPCSADLGKPHLFKRSLLLVKAWGLYESGPLMHAMEGAEPLPVLCSRGGRLSSHALSVMLLALFNETAEETAAYRQLLEHHAATRIFDATAGLSGRRGGAQGQGAGGEGASSCAVPVHGAPEAAAALQLSVDLVHPLSVLSRFLRCYSSFDWDRFALTVDGPVPLRPGIPAPCSVSCAGRPGSSADSSFWIRNQEHCAPRAARPLDHALTKVRDCLNTAGDGGDGGGGAAQPAPEGLRLASGFVVRPGMNIVDPLDPTNNLGAGVSRCSAQAITVACDWGRHRLEALVAHMSVKSGHNPSSGMASGPAPPAGRPFRASAIPAAADEADATSLDLLRVMFPAALAAYGPHPSLSPLMPVLEAPARSLRAGEVKPGGCTHTQETLRFVEGNGFRSDLLDHPLQKQPATLHQAAGLGYDVAGKMLGGGSTLDTLNAAIASRDAPARRRPRIVVGTLESSTPPPRSPACGGDKTPDKQPSPSCVSTPPHNRSSPLPAPGFLPIKSDAAVDKPLPLPAHLSEAKLRAASAEARLLSPATLPAAPAPHRKEKVRGRDKGRKGKSGAPSDAASHSAPSEAPSPALLFANSPGATRSRAVAAVSGALLLMAAGGAIWQSARDTNLVGSGSCVSPLWWGPSWDERRAVEASVEEGDERAGSNATPSKEPQQLDLSPENDVAFPISPLPDPPADPQSSNMFHGDIVRWIIRGGDAFLGDLAAPQQSEYKWLKNGQVVDGALPFLTITAASLADEGAYECLTREHGAEFVQFFAVTVRIAVPPSVSSSFVSWTLAVGGNLRLEAANATGVPPPQCSWIYLGTVVKPGQSWGGADVKLETGENGAIGGVLSVSGVTDEHGGTYTSVCRNAVGVAVWEEALIIVRYQAPQPPSAGAALTPGHAHVAQPQEDRRNASPRAAGPKVRGRENAVSRGAAARKEPPVSKKQATANAAGGATKSKGGRKKKIAKAS